MLTDCDRTGMPAYLEATSERNRDLYQRHGFEVSEVVTLPDGRHSGACGGRRKPRPDSWRPRPAWQLICHGG